MSFKQASFITLLLFLTIIQCVQAASIKENSAQRSILILATNHVSEKKLQLFSRLASQKGLITVDYRFLRTLEEGDSLTDLVAPYDLIIFDSISAREVDESYSRFESVVKADEDRRFLPIKVTGESTLRKGITADQSQELYDYYYNGGEKNLSRMQVFLRSDLFGLSEEKALPPIIFPDLGIYHPAFDKKVFANLTDYKVWKKSKADAPVIGIAISRESIAADNTVIIDALIQAIEKRSGVAVAFYYPSRSEDEIINLLNINGTVAIDTIINTRIIHWAEKRRAEYEQLGVPVLQVLPYTQGSQSDWEKDQAGIPAEVTPFYLTLPEIAGAIDPMVISARVNTEGADTEDKSQTPIDYQLNNVVSKAIKLATLKHKANRDKKVAITFYNYPAGEKNASASFLTDPEIFQLT